MPEFWRTHADLMGLLVSSPGNMSGAGAAIDVTQSMQALSIAGSSATGSASSIAPPAPRPSAHTHRARSAQAVGQSVSRPSAPVGAAFSPPRFCPQQPTVSASHEGASQPSASLSPVKHAGARPVRAAAQTSRQGSTPGSARVASGVSAPSVLGSRPGPVQRVGTQEATTRLRDLSDEETKK